METTFGLGVQGMKQGKRFQGFAWNRKQMKEREASTGFWVKGRDQKWTLVLGGFTGAATGIHSPTPY